MYAEKSEMGFYENWVALKDTRTLRGISLDNDEKIVHRVASFFRPSWFGRAADKTEIARTSDKSNDKEEEKESFHVPHDKVSRFQRDLRTVTKLKSANFFAEKPK